MRVVDNPLHSIDYCKEVQPHLFIGVPRIYEKVYSNLMAALGSKLGLLKIPVLGGIIKKKATEAIFLLASGLINTLLISQHQSMFLFLQCLLWTLYPELRT